MGVALSLCAQPLEARILRLLAKDSSDRPESAKEVLTELEAVDPQEVSPESGPTQESGQVLDRLVGCNWPTSWWRYRYRRPPRECWTYGLVESSALCWKQS